VYREVLPGVDIRVQARVSGFEQLWVIKDRAGLERFVAARGDGNEVALAAPFTVGKASVSPARDGSLELVDDKDRVVGQLQSPTMWDGKVDPRSDRPAEVKPVAFALSAAGVDVSPIPIPQSTSTSVAKATVTVPRTVGGHSIRTYAVGPAGLQTGTAHYLGWGNAPLLHLPKPAPRITTTGAVEMKAAGPPKSGTFTPTAKTQWRVSGCYGFERLGRRTRWQRADGELGAPVDCNRALRHHHRRGAG
jgi:hypothetical protein